MARIISNKRASALFEDDLDAEEFGVETEAERQMKVILQKQLTTQISMKEQFAQHRSFVSPSTYKSLTELVQGTCTVETFIALEKNEEIHQELQRCGLNEDEIADYLAFKSGKRIENRLVNPSIFQERILRIEGKIKAHNDDLLKPQTFKNVKRLTRHEMEIEKTLYAGCPEKSKLASLVSTEDGCESSSKDDPFVYIKDLSNKLLQKCKKNRKKRKMQEAVASMLSSSKEDSDFMFDRNIHHVVVPLEDDEIVSRRLSIEEIRQLPKFGNYTKGEPSKTLYLKNLHNKVTAQELRSVFIRFEKESGPPMDYRICTGRMKGQAFITFPDSETAEKALDFANGFMLREKPIIIEFGRKP